eukprot:10555235-Ditylum_brightwellii.AAC.1
METLSSPLQRPDGNEHLDVTSPLIHDPPNEDYDTQWAGFISWMENNMKPDVQHTLPSLLQSD